MLIDIHIEGCTFQRNEALMMKRSVIAALWLTAISTSAQAQELGQYGNEWAIEEPHGVQRMIERLEEMEKSGKLQAIQERYRDEYINGLENPDPVPGITTVIEPTTYYVDPTYTVHENIYDDQGRLAVLAGTRINPFNFMAWSKSIILIDAREQWQVDFAMKRLKEHPKDKVILTGGSYLDMMRETEQRVYYDINGNFTTRFNIKRVPAVVSQVDKKIKVVEIGQ